MAVTAQIFLKKAYHLIPIKFRYRCATFAWNCSEQLKRFLGPIYPQIFIFKGLEKNSQLPLTFAYIGPPSQTQEYWAQTTLAPGFQKHPLGQHFCISIVPFLRKTSADCNFLIIECNPWTLSYFSKKPGFNIPRWVTTQIDIAMPVETLLGSGRLGIVRRIRKHQLTYEMTREQKHLDDFYHHMYLPHIQTRYKNTAFLNGYQKHLEIFSKGELILIKKDGAVIAGGLLEFDDKNAFFRLLGIRDGNPEFVQQGAIGALYYFIIVEMKKRNYPKITVGGTRPFLNDGLTKFKRSLKAKINPNDPNGRIWLKLLKEAPGLQHFLINNPFIFYPEDEQPHRAVFMEANADHTQRELKETLNACACEGIEKTKLFIFSKVGPLADYAALLEEPSLSVLPAKELFPEKD